MVDSKMDIIKSDPIGALSDASKISLGGGGALFIAALWLINQKYGVGWKVNDGIIYLLLGGAILMAALYVGLKALDVVIRYMLASKLIEVKGTSDPKAAKKLPIIVKDNSELLNRILDKPLVSYIIAPGTQTEGAPASDPPT